MKKTVFSIMLVFGIIISAFSLNAFAAEMADGTYEVNIALWHSEDDKESMAADSVGAKATIVVADGIKTMHITSGEMSMMGIKASLQELRIADANGNFTDAKVEARNSEGNPTGFYFTMPHTNQYITVKVNPHLAIMGNKDIGARIKVDYSSLKLVKTAEAVTEPEAETGISDVTNTSEDSVTEIVTSEAIKNDDPEIISETDSVETTPEQSNVQDTPEKEKNAIAAVISVIALVAIIFVARKIKQKK